MKTQLIAISCWRKRGMSIPMNEVAQARAVLTFLAPTNALVWHGLITPVPRFPLGRGVKWECEGFHSSRWKCETKEVSRCSEGFSYLKGVRMIYVIMFNRKLGNLSNPRAQAQFYVGYCDDARLGDRIAEHLSGQGAAITRAARKQGIGMQVVLTMPGDRSKEREIKNYKNTPKWVKKELEKRGRDVFLSPL
jgi:predicted GIY-YIG superfamily endonuclease